MHRSQRRLMLAGLMSIAKGPSQSHGWASSRAVGVSAGAAMLLLYASAVAAASGSLAHLVDQVASDWYLILPIAAGFGTQIGLLLELRRRHRLHREAAAAGAAGAGTSTVGMLACCAHHLADLFPLVGATAAATLVYDYRVPFMVIGLALNGVAISVAVRRLREVRTMQGMRHEEVHQACASAGSSR